MSYHFAMGAINKTTNKYEYPRIANKCNKYKCPSCEKVKSKDLCFPVPACDTIINPLQFGRKRV